ncbi:MAG: hypothetical protein LBS86_06850, partial [Treponema sp.]|nr:hypothetical protein [Treponema sp.]
CRACGWTDDPVQSANPDLAGGANRRSLNQARIDWLAEQETLRQFIEARKASSPPFVPEASNDASCTENAREETVAFEPL